MDEKVDAGRERALVTGASSGIGREIARVLAEKGYDLVVTARRRERLEELAAELKNDHGVAVDIVVADLATSSGVEKVINEVGEIDILVNNAGYGSSGNHTELDAATELGMLDLNIRALTKLSHHFGGQMAKRQEVAKRKVESKSGRTGRKKITGRILNVASIAAFQPGPSMAVYCATKAYVLSYSRALRYELKPKGVTVTTLCPGPVVTEFQGVSGLHLPLILRPYLVTAEKVAKSAVRALMRGRREVLPGLMNKPLPLIVRLTPVRLQMVIMKTMLN
jgi:short-subunit dehydrogenase